VQPSHRPGAGVSAEHGLRSPCAYQPFQPYAVAATSVVSASQASSTSNLYGKGAAAPTYTFGHTPLSLTPAHLGGPVARAAPSAYTSTAGQSHATLANSSAHALHTRPMPSRPQVVQLGRPDGATATSYSVSTAPAAPPPPKLAEPHELLILKMGLSPSPPLEGASAARQGLPEQHIAHGGRFAHVLAPDGVHPEEALPVVFALHGCWQFRTERDMAYCAAMYREMANQAHAVVIVPWAKDHTWDFVMTQGRASGDTAFFAWCLEETRRLHRIDEGRVAIMGFSDGASFGLSLAVANPDIFEAVLVWAAGFCLPPPPPSAMPLSRPRVFMWHGVEDQIFDIRSVSLPVRDHLHAAGLEVHYHAEEGGRHVCPQPGSEFCNAALEFWLAAPRRSSAA